MRLAFLVAFLVAFSLVSACSCCCGLPSPWRTSISSGAAWLWHPFYNLTVYGNVTSNDTITAWQYCLDGVCLTNWTEAGNASVGGGGLDLSAAPFITYAENASLTHDVPLSRLNVSITPDAALNASLSLGSASSYWLALHSSSAFLGTLYSPLFALSLSPATNKTLSLGSATAYLLGMHSSFGYFLSLNVADYLTANNASFSGNVSIAENLSVTKNVSADNASFGSYSASRQSGFRAYNSSAFTLAPMMAMQKIRFDTENWDRRGEFDNSANSRFTAKEAGTYLACAQMDCTNLGAVTNTFTINISQNGVTNVTYLAQSSGYVIPSTAGVCYYFQLAAGDYLEVWATQTQLLSKTCVPGSPNTWFAVQKVA